MQIDTDGPVNVSAVVFRGIAEKVGRVDRCPAFVFLRADVLAGLAAADVAVDAANKLVMKLRRFFRRQIQIAKPLSIETMFRLVNAGHLPAGRRGKRPELAGLVRRGSGRTNIVLQLGGEILSDVGLAERLISLAALMHPGGQSRADQHAKQQFAKGKTKSRGQVSPDVDSRSR